MYRKYLQEIALREKQTGDNCSASTSTSSTLTHHPDPQSSENTRIPPEPSTPHGHHHSTESGNQNAQNTAPNNSTGTQNPAQAPQKELTEEQKKIEKQKRELEGLLETVDQTEKIIFMAFPFQEAIVLGNFYATFPNTMKTIRIFTSSTFTDTKYERNYWMEKAYPKIKEHCFKKGYEFQVVDMRWGIRNQATDDHMTTELCLHELRECQKLSKGPNFISLFAHKYGYRSLSREINGEEFRKIQGAVTNQADLEHLLRWYELDSNAVPDVFLLKPISRNIPDFLSKDFETQKKAKSQWWSESERLMEIIDRGASEGLDEASARKYKISVTELETEVALNADNAIKNSFWFRKDFKDIEKQENCYTLSRYIECLGDEEVWQKARAMNKDLKGRMTSKLNADHVHTYELNWTEKGIDPDCSEHADYLEKITTDFQNQMIASIDESIRERETNKKLTLRPDHEEFMEHAVLVKKKCDGVRGRDHIVKKIKDYVLGDSKEPLVVHGESGCGKTSIMALAAREAFSWIHGNGMVIMRFLGSTQESSNVVSLLQSMISQIEEYLKVKAVKSQDLKHLIKTFKMYLRFFVLRRKTIVIFIDSIDQLDKSHNGRLVSTWIPNNLLKAAKIIISTIDHPNFGVFPDIKSFVSDANFISVPLLTPEDRIDVLDNWFKINNRKLTDGQRSYVLSLFEKCSLPLYIKLCFRKAIKWTSFHPIEECQLEDTIRGCIDKLFISLENKHGELFVARALGYVTVAKHGLSEFELEDILSCDDDVLNDVYQFWTPPIRRLPPLLIVRLRHDLNRYLVNRGDSGVQIMGWYHRQFWEAAEDRYTKDKDTCQRLHVGIADYFAGRWSGDVPKPYKDKHGESEAIRYVASQPIQLGNQMNERKLKSLPYHLAMSGNLSDLKKECLLKFDFLIHKLLCLHTQDLLDDFDLAISLFPGEQDLRSLSQAINLSAAALTQDPRQLPGHLLDRLERIQSLQDLLTECRHSPYPYVLCSHFLLKKPGGQLVRTLTGHNTAIDSLDLHQYPEGKLVALTASEGDHLVKTWDVHAGKELKSIPSMQSKICKAEFAVDGEIILQVYEDKIYGCNSGGDVKYTIDVPTIAVTTAGQKKSNVVAIGKKEFILWDATTGNEIKRKELPPKLKPDSLECISGSENFVAFTGDIMGYLCVYNVREDTFSRVVKMKDDEDINSMAISSDETHIIISKGLDSVVLVDIANLNEMRTLEALKHLKCIDKMYSHNGSMVLCNDKVVCISNETGSEVSSHFPHSISLIDVRTCDMKLFVTRSQDNILRVWDITREDVQNKLPQQNNNIRIILSMKNPRYSLIHRQDKEENTTIYEIYDLLKHQVIKRIALDTNVSEEVLLDDDDTLIVSTKNDKLKAISLETATVVAEFEGFLAQSCEVRVINGGKEIVTQTRGRQNLKCYDTKTGKVTKTIQLSTSDKKYIVDAFVASSDGQIIACVTEDETFLVCDAEKKKVIKTLRDKDIGKGVSDIGLEIDISRNGIYAIGSMQLKRRGNITTPFVWNKEEDTCSILFDEEELKSYQQQGKSASDLEIYSTKVIKDELLAVGYLDGAIRLWDLKLGKLHMKLSGHTDVLDLVMAPGGSFLMSYCDMEEENSMRIWDVDSWECVATYRSEIVFGRMTAGSDGKSFLAETDNNVVHLTLNDYDKEELEKLEIKNKPKELDYKLKVLTDNDNKVSDDDPDKEGKRDFVFSDDDDDDDDEKNKEEEEQGGNN